MKRYRHIWGLALLLIMVMVQGADLTHAQSANNTLRTYTDPDGLWQVQYPADLLTPQVFGGGITIFISRDRSTVAVVDSYLAPGNAYGNTGEDLRNRARETLAAVYGTHVNETGFIAPMSIWNTGITFTTDKGSKGEAIYRQDASGDTRVHGFSYGYKVRNERSVAVQLLGVRASFKVLAKATPAQVRARNTLVGFFQHLADGEYNRAVQLYGGDYDLLRGYNPTIARNNYAALWKAACTQNGFQCVPVRAMIREQAARGGGFIYQVEFVGPDGGKLAVRPCCDSTLKPITTWTYIVKPVNNVYLVQGLPVYMS